LRKIRNQLAHEDEDDAIEMANIINLIYAKKEAIESIYLVNQYDWSTRYVAVQRLTVKK
jgi:hypothetical protein